MLGGSGADRFFATDGSRDIIKGQTGADRADDEDTDNIDVLTSIETM